jgi:hypothetical protein
MSREKPRADAQRGLAWTTAITVMARRYRIERGAAWQMLWEWSRSSSIPADDLAKMIVEDALKRDELNPPQGPT